ncbi:YicC/YloC family endoribonuclease [Flavobacterium selenitireducens]|uniref:YicC/YloC family endoribonuclease n=1 Tax=Flavobacterium selenitireducens TaxID=2722704 RepID=UPI00168B4840|nr:YicC/YloC family endoribonuclease [Flavobacterium selenitireducens]MBD3582065.1 YicC family protein [Flavobacterium selenitireducens]
MIQSMTGFGKATLQLAAKKITVEIKSLNSKGLDLSVRMPSAYREMELGLRSKLSNQLERGKIDFAIYVENTTEQTSTRVNVPIVRAYIAQLLDIYPAADETELMKMAVRMPDALKTEREEMDENEWKQIEGVIADAVNNIQSFRIAEGSSLEKEFLQRIANIMTMMNATVAMDAERIDNVKKRLLAAIDDLKVTLDENRFEQELIFYLEKYDITEEKVRLENHLNYFIQTLADKEANGRKLGFITQEMGREINTMGSKSNHAAMQKLVVQMKDELEKIKEQVLNVL